jgi:hypothetical protein
MTPAKPSSRSSIRPLPFASFHTIPLNDTYSAIEGCISDKVGVNEGDRLAVSTVETVELTSFDTRMPSTEIDEVDISKANCVNSDSKESSIGSFSSTSAVVTTSVSFFSVLRFIFVVSSTVITSADEMQIVTDRSRRQRSIVVELLIFKIFGGITLPLR